MKKATKSIGIVLIALLLVLCIAVDALAVRYSTVITRFWSGIYGSVQTDTDDTQLKATDAAAELTQIIAEEGIVLMKNNGLLPMAPSKDTRSIALLGYASYSPMYIGAGSVSQAGSYVSNDFILCSPFKCPVFARFFQAEAIIASRKNFARGAGASPVCAEKQCRPLDEAQKNRTNGRSSCFNAYGFTSRSGSGTSP